MVEGTEEELRIAGPGAPPVAEFCVAEFALAVGMSTAAGQRYLGDAVETRYRLPRLWGRVVAGQVPVWKARRIPQAALTLPPEGATYVDVHLAPVAERCTFAALDRAVEEARARFDPDRSRGVSDLLCKGSVHLKGRWTLWQRNDRGAALRLPRRWPPRARWM